MRIQWLTRGSSLKSRQKSPSVDWRGWRLFLVPAIGLAVVCQLAVSSSAGATLTAAAVNAKTAASGAVTPKQVNELDCNGWSNKYGIVRQLAGDLCTDPIQVINRMAHRFIDNGWYVGHDEPSTRFISSQPGSGNTMTYVMKMPEDPVAAPTANGHVVDYAQLSVAPWFGLPMCDSKSYPQNPCTPDSDTNGGQFDNPNAAGSALMDLAVLPAGLHPVPRQHELQRHQVVRRGDHRQPGVHLRLYHLQRQLRGAGQLRLPADQQRSSRAPEPAVGRREHVHAQRPHADDQPR